MKNSMKCMCMIALVVLAFTSCKKTDEKVGSTFRATIHDAEYEVVDGDRAYVSNDNTIQFEVGDVCMLFNISKSTPSKSHCATYEALEGGNTVTFQNCGLGELGGNKLDTYMAFYPGGPNCTQTQLIDGENKAKFHIEPVQEYRVDKVSLGDLFMCATVNYHNLDDAYFTFYNLCGILQLQPYEAAQRTVTSITVVDNEFDLAGWVELILPEINPLEMKALLDNYDPSNTNYTNSLNEYKNRVGYNVTDAEYSILLNTVGEESPNGVQLGASKATTPKFNIVLRPLALSQGCHIIFHFNDGSVKDVDLSQYNLMMKSNVVKNLGLNLDAF